MIPEFVRVRGEVISLLLVALVLVGAVRPVADLLGLERRRVGDLFWNAGAAFVIAGRIVYLLRADASTLLDPLVLVRVQGGVDVIAGTFAVAVVATWHARHAAASARAASAAAAALGLAIATAGYDGACVVRDACYGATAPAPLGFRMAGLAETRLATPLIETAAILLLLALLLRAWPRLRPATVAAWTCGGLALLRAALTPESVAGRSAVDAATAVTLLAGLVAIAAGAWIEWGLNRRGGRAAG